MTKHGLHRVTAVSALPRHCVGSRMPDLRLNSRMVAGLACKRRQCFPCPVIGYTARFNSRFEAPLENKPCTVCFRISRPEQEPLGLLILRLVTGAAFMFHGWFKIQSAGGAFGWMGPNASVPGFLQGLAILAEFGGGLALILGLLTPLAGLGIACTMIVALSMVHIPHGDPFVAQGKPSFELPAVYLANVILILLLGPGIISLDEVVFRRRATGAHGKNV